MTLQVERIETDRGSDIKPPLNPDWDNLTKLRWCAAVASLDTGLVVEVHEFPSNYCIVVNAPSGGTLTSTSSSGFHATWTLLSGITIGARAAMRTPDRVS